MGGRPRTPDAIHEVTGAKKKNPARFRSRGAEPQSPGSIGDPPESLLRPSSDRDKLIKKWEYLKSIAPIGLLTLSDSEYLASLCRLAVLAERCGARTELAANKAYMNELEKGGFTPRGRAVRGLGGKAPEAKNPLEDFLKPRRA